MNFRFLSGDYEWEKYGGVFISKSLNSGRYNYYLILSVDNLRHGQQKKPGARGYNIRLSAVSPELFNWKANNISGFVGFSKGKFSSESNQLEKDRVVNSIYQSFGGAFIWEYCASNLKNMLPRARLEADIAHANFHHVMSGAQNSAGASGTDMLRGNNRMGGHAVKKDFPVIEVPSGFGV